MRALYAERQRVLVKAVHTRLAGRMELRPGEAGMHLVGRLPDGTDDVAVARRALDLGGGTEALSICYREVTTARGLLLGYAAIPAPTIEAGVDRLAEALSQTKTL